LTVFALLFLVSLAAAAAEERINGTVTSIDLQTKSVVVTSYQGRQETIFISDEDTASLAKLRDGRIKAGDDIKVKYVVKDGRNVATYFKKPAGC
ncbi:MAG TPA: hypothetical protein VIX18_06670, partial [Nitrospirota bacterium]